ncbi:unnamed protein product [Larinioides sclopetarius]|uniref:Uncharacterized protein n=1 Tax=Larinioides sclopetarius TaxID=280406 RepID=A0AAV2BJJ8_9ARAC
MSGGRYYFPEITGNNALSHVAQLSKKTLKEGEKIVEIFQKNYKLLYEKSPGQISFLMKQNNQSIFDLSPNNLANYKQQEINCLAISKSSENQSTPVKRNPILHRKCLSNDDTMKEASESTVYEIETVIIRQRRIFSPKNATQAKDDPITDVHAIVDEVFASPTTPSSKCVDNSVEENKNPFPSSTGDENVTVDQNVVSPNASKMADNPDVANQESPRSAQTTEMLASLNVDDCESGIPPKFSIMSDEPPIGIQNSDNNVQIVENANNNCTAKQELLEEGLKICNLAKEEKHTPSPVKLAKVTSNNTPESESREFIGSEEKVGISVNPDTKVTNLSLSDNRMNISPIGRKTIAITEEKRKSPSPRRNKLFFRSIPRIICSDESDELDIEFSCESEGSPSPTTSKFPSKNLSINKTANNELIDNSTANENIRSDVLDELNVRGSPEITERKLNPSGNKTHICSSQNRAEIRTKTCSPTTDRGYLPRKTISPSTKPFKETSPKTHDHRISPSEKKVSINSPHIFSKPDNLDKDKDYSPICSISPSTKISPKINKFKFSPSDKKSRINTPENVTEKDSPFEIKGSFLRQISPSVSCLKTETSIECDGDSNGIPKQVDDSDSNVLNWFLNKLTKLISLRDDYMNYIFESFSEFQKDLNFLFLYVKKIVYVVDNIPTEGQINITEEFKKVTVNLTANAHKLVEKFSLWKLAGDSEIQAWIQYFDEIRKIKSHKETRIHTDASLVEHMRFLRAYEKDLKSVWKKMDDLKILEDARRSSLLNAALDFEMLIKLFLKCLINIGALKLRSKTTPM